MARPNRLIYGEVQQLVPIKVMGRSFDVPDGIPLIRAFQYIQYELKQMQSDWTLYCFNDTIGCCNFEFMGPDEQAPDWGRACCQRVVAGLEVHTLPQGSFLLDEDGKPIQ